MAKKNNGGGGRKTSIWDNPFGGVFDFNRDGREDLFEQWVASKSYEQWTTSHSNSHGNYSSDCFYPLSTDDDTEDTSWRDFCEDGMDYDLDPDDYDTEEEYEDALKEAKANAGCTGAFGGKKTCRGDTSKEVKEEDYPNKRRYSAAFVLANDLFSSYDSETAQKHKARCRFIVDNADSITAANYLSYYGGFLYAQAIKDNFTLPVSLPDEDEEKEYELSEALCKIAKRNIALSVEVWEWVLNTFLPYTQYATGSLSEMTSEVIDDIYSFPEEYRTELARYMDKAPDFMEKVMDCKSKVSEGIDEVIEAALSDGLMETASRLFERSLIQADNDWRRINELTSYMISSCKNYNELETAEYFKLNMLPYVKAIDIGMVQDEIDGWEKELDDYISRLENTREDYAALLTEKLQKEHNRREQERRELAQQKERKLRDRLEKERQIEVKKAFSDDTVYTFCGVLFPHATQPYHYRTDDSAIKVGDKVIVLAGGKNAIGKVVSVGQYMRIAAPYPVDKASFIIKKSED